MLVVDYILVSILLVSTVIGIFRGFVKEALSLAVWFAAIWIAMRYGSLGADAFELDSITDHAAMGYAGDHIDTRSGCWRTRELAYRDARPQERTVGYR